MSFKKTLISAHFLRILCQKVFFEQKKPYLVRVKNLSKAIVTIQENNNYLIKFFIFSQVMCIICIRYVDKSYF